MTTTLSRNGTRQPQELNCVRGHVMRERQEHGGGQDLPGLHALQREAGEEAAPAERRVLEDHRAGAGDFAGDRESLDQPQQHQQDRREHADLLVGRQHADCHGRECPSGTCRPAARSCGHACRPSGPGRRRRSAARHSPRRRSPATRRSRPWVARREEDLRKDQRGGGGVDEEVVVLERRADPAAGGGLAGLMSAMRLVFGKSGHIVPPSIVRPRGAGLPRAACRSRCLMARATGTRSWRKPRPRCS